MKVIDLFTLNYPDATVSDFSGCSVGVDFIYHCGDKFLIGTLTSYFSACREWLITQEL